MKHAGLSKTQAKNLLFSLCPSARIYTCETAYYQKKSGAILEDGVASVPDGLPLYNYYINGRRSGIVNFPFMVNLLTDCNFETEE